MLGKSFQRLFRLKPRLQDGQLSPLRALEPIEGLELRHLGSSYGGWVIVHTESVRGSVLLSAGAGEDISFDVEMASAYDMKAVLVDPTPRAVAHVKEVSARAGQRRTQGYSLGGEQPVQSYELSRLSDSSIQLVEAALWVDDGGVDLLPPLDQSRVSHSIFQKKNSDVSSSINVDSISPGSLADFISAKDVYVAKLDIEGAEVDVIPGLLEAFPHLQQFLIEFDVEKTAREDSGEALARSLNALKSRGFRLAHKSGRNYLFAHEVLL